MKYKGIEAAAKALNANLKDQCSGKQLPGPAGNWWSDDMGMIDLLQQANVAVDAYLENVWTDFNPEDPDTHPPSEYAPSGRKWLIENKDGRLSSMIFHNLWGRVVRYADPADLTVRG